MKARSASGSHSPIGYTQSAPASRYAFARSSASGTSSCCAPGSAPASIGPKKTSTRALITSG